MPVDNASRPCINRWLFPFQATPEELPSPLLETLVDTPFWMGNFDGH
jgi:hypothetical protein